VSRGEFVTVTTKGYSCEHGAVSGTEQVVFTGPSAFDERSTYASTSVRVSRDGAFTATLRVPVTITSGPHFIAGWGPTGYHCWQGSCAVYGTQITVRP